MYPLIVLSIAVVVFLTYTVGKIIEIIEAAAVVINPLVH